MPGRTFEFKGSDETFGRKYLVIYAMECVLLARGVALAESPQTDTTKFVPKK